MSALFDKIAWLVRSTFLFAQDICADELLGIPGNSCESAQGPGTAMACICQYNLQYIALPIHSFIARPLHL